MSIATALLLAGAIGIVLVMHLVGHGPRRAHERHEAQFSSPRDRKGGSEPRKPAGGGHGCCG
jgi:hypothetical protein